MFKLGFNYFNDEPTKKFSLISESCYSNFRICIKLTLAAIIHFSAIFGSWLSISIRGCAQRSEGSLVRNAKSCMTSNRPNKWFLNTVDTAHWAVPNRMTADCPCPTASDCLMALYTVLLLLCTIRLFDGLLVCPKLALLAWTGGFCIKASAQMYVSPCSSLPLPTRTWPGWLCIWTCIWLKEAL